MSKLREKRRKSRVPVLSAAEAVQMIPSGAVVAFTGAGGGIVEPTELILALAERYRNTKAPQDLTLMAMTGLGDRGDRGLSPWPRRGCAAGRLSAIGDSRPGLPRWRSETRLRHTIIPRA